MTEKLKPEYSFFIIINKYIQMKETVNYTTRVNPVKIEVLLYRYVINILRNIHNKKPSQDKT